MVKTAAILAAGLGSRLGEKAADGPKGLLEIGKESLLGRSVRLLLAAGIDRIILGTGWRADKYAEYFADSMRVVCVPNNYYLRCGNMATLYAMRSWLEGDDFLLLESDILYEPRALAELLAYPARNVILASGLTQAGDEVFIQTDEHDYLVNMSKDKDALGSIRGELVGISKISAKLYMNLCALWEVKKERERQLAYEYALVACGRFLPLMVHVVEDLVWCEIDDKEHWRRAREVIYPKLLGHEEKHPA